MSKDQKAPLKRSLNGAPFRFLWRYASSLPEQFRDLPASAPSIATRSPRLPLCHRDNDENCSMANLRALPPGRVPPDCDGYNGALNELALTPNVEVVVPLQPERFVSSQSQ